MRTDTLYLTDILESAEHIRRFVGAATEDEFMRHDMMKSAVLQKLMVIGEAAARISKELAARHPEIPWRDMAGFRNIAVHAYFSVDWKIIWITATQDIPELVQQISGVVQEAEASPEPSGDAT